MSSCFWLSLAVFYLAGWSVMKKAHLGAPLLALLIGLVIGNLFRIPDWFKTSLLTEYYIKTGIVLLGSDASHDPHFQRRSLLRSCRPPSSP